MWNSRLPDFIYRNIKVFALILTNSFGELSAYKQAKSVWRKILSIVSPRNYKENRSSDVQHSLSFYGIPKFSHILRSKHLILSWKSSTSILITSNHRAWKWNSKHRNNEQKRTASTFSRYKLWFNNEHRPRLLRQTLQRSLNSFEMKRQLEEESEIRWIENCFFLLLVFMFPH